MRPLRQAERGPRAMHYFWADHPLPVPYLTVPMRGIGIKCVSRDALVQKERQLYERRRQSATVERDFEAAASTLGYEWLHPSVPLRPTLHLAAVGQPVAKFKIIFIWCI